MGENSFWACDVMVPGEYYIIDSVPFFVRSIDRIYISTAGCTVIAFTAQTLDEHDVYADTLTSDDFDSIKPLKKMLDEKFERGYNAPML
jgi:hypothetical protein